MILKIGTIPLIFIHNEDWLREEFKNKYCFNLKSAWVLSCRATTFWVHGNQWVCTVIDFDISKIFRWCFETLFKNGSVMRDVEIVEFLFRQDKADCEGLNQRTPSLASTFTDRLAWTSDVTHRGSWIVPEIPRSCAFLWPFTNPFK